VLLLKLIGHPEDAAEIAGVLAEGEDVRIRRHGGIEGAVQRLDHVEAGHQCAPWFLGAGAGSGSQRYALATFAAPRPRARKIITFSPVLVGSICPVQPVMFSS
jgi:hypothetical protein